MSTDQRVRSAVERFGPAVAGIVVAALGFAWFVQPELSAYLQARTDTVSLQTRVRALENTLARAGSPPQVDTAGPVQAFEKAVSAEDRVPDVIEILARNALASAPAGRIEGLLIEAGERVNAPLSPVPNAPRVAGNEVDQPDPRVGLFTQSIEYTPVTVSFDSSFDTIGEFLWRLRDLPTTVEIRSMRLTRGLPLMRAELTGYVYRRSRAGSAPPDAAGGARSAAPVPRVAALADELASTQPPGTGR